MKRIVHPFAIASMENIVMPPILRCLLCLLLLAGGGMSCVCAAQAPVESEPWVPHASVRTGTKESSAPAGAAGTTGMLEILVEDEQGARACRVEVRNADGDVLVDTPGMDGIWCDGHARLALPCEPVNLRVSAGPRYTIHQGAAGATTVAGEITRVRLNPFGKVSHLGWHAADPWVASTAPARSRPLFGFTSLAGLTTACRGEGLAVAAVAGAWQLPSPQGNLFCEATEGGLLLAAAFAAQRTAAFASLSAWRYSRSDELLSFYVLDTTPQDVRSLLQMPAVSAMQAARQRGGVVILLPPCKALGSEDLQVRRRALAAMAGATLAGPAFDALDISGGNRAWGVWQGLLMSGMPITAVRGGPHTGGEAPPQIGCYLQLPDAVSADVALEALRNGRCVVSNGPFVQMRVDSCQPGDRLPVSGKTHTVFIEGIACSDPDDNLARIELIINGTVHQGWDTPSNQPFLKQLKINLLRELPDMGWLQARYISTNRRLRAITNPIYIRPPQYDRRPTMARVHLQLLGTAGKPVAGEVEISLGERRLQRLAVPLSGADVEMPLLAVCQVSADGYASQTRSLLDAEPFLSLVRTDRTRGYPAQQQLKNAGFWHQMRSGCASLRWVISLSEQRHTP